MRANVITFAHPMPKIYKELPPPPEELDKVLAFMFTGPCQPTQEDFKHTPMLVCMENKGDKSVRVAQTKSSGLPFYQYFIQ